MSNSRDAVPLRPRIGVLALTLELYESLAPGLRADREAWLRRDLLPRFKSFADVEFDGAVFRRREVESTLAAYEARGCDAVVVVLLTYSPSQIALPGLRRVRLPILIWNIQELHAVDRTFTAAEMIANHGVHGTQDLANVLLRSGVAFEYVTSHSTDSAPAGPIRDFAAAAAAVRSLDGLRIGLLGYPFPGMGDFAVDTTDMAARLGCEWTHLSTEEFAQRCAAADSAATTDLIATYRASYEVDRDVTDADLDVTARAELALRGMIRDRCLGAFSSRLSARMNAVRPCRLWRRAGSWAKVSVSAGRET
ncbi:MAG: hypothetical protein GXP31_07575 [Kiritimatiellaeota bacterium]|nr:hypothetical protein [Kiritimatiellota bacterium]